MPSLSPQVSKLSENSILTFPTCVFDYRSGQFGTANHKNMNLYNTKKNTRTLAAVAPAEAGGIGSTVLNKIFFVPQGGNLTSSIIQKKTQEL
jgi:hypothetical protein